MVTAGDLPASLISSRRLRQPLHLEFLGHREEGVELLLADQHLAVVDELQDVFKDRELDTVEVDDGMGVRILEEDGPQLGTGG